MSNDICEVNCIHIDKVSRAKRKLEEQNPYEVAKVFKALSDETRIKIVYVLSLEDELCVCDVATIINASNATASHHLRLLRDLGIAKHRKEGKLVYYSIVDEHVKQLVQKTFDHEREVVKVGTSC